MNESPLIKAQKIKKLPEKAFQHPLNDNAVRNTKSLGDLVGLKHLGVHLVRVEQGKESTQFHFHHLQEEFLYILSGRGIAEIGDKEFEIEVGDFMAFTAPSLPHSMKNPYKEDLVYLMSGERRETDVTDYPRLHKRMYNMSGSKQLIDLNNLEEI